MSGLIYAAIVAAWALYLVPLALRRHDEAVRARSAHRFSSAMRVLGRRHAGTPVLSRQDALARAVDATPPAPRRRPSRAAAKRAAARRRRVLALLLAVCVVVAGLAVAGLVPWWAVAFPALLCLGFLAVCRRQVRTETEAYWSAASARSGLRVRSGFGDPPNDEPTVTLRRLAPPATGTPAPAAAAEPAAAAIDPAALEPPQRALPVAVPTAEGGSLWDPLPVTLPTYLTKPAAPRTIRTVNLVRPESAAEPDEPDVEVSESEPRRAVNS